MTAEKKEFSDAIHIEKILPGKRWQVFRLITSIEDFPNYMPNVRKAEFIEKTKTGAITKWFVDIDGLPIRWKQEDRFEFSKFSIYFKAIEGDIEYFEGVWTLQPGPGDSTVVILNVSIRLGIPIFEHVVADVLRAKIQKNFEMMLHAMEEDLIRHRYQSVDGKPSTKIKGFVVMGHPYNFNHLVRIFKVFKPDISAITPDFLMKIFELSPAYLSSDIRDYRSECGKIVDGYFVMCPIIPDMALLNPEIVINKVLDGCRIGERLGAGILALGGFTSIVGERYFNKLKSQVKIPVTTGNAFTTAMALEGVRKACQLMEIDFKKARAVVIGGTGDIGSACARVLVNEVAELVVTGRTPSALEAIENQLKMAGGAKITATLDNNRAVTQADIIIAAASSSQTIVDIKYIKPGAVVCDVAYPKNISYSTSNRDDIFVFSGGLASIPSPFNLGFDVGLPSQHILYGCFAEAMILSLEERYENFSEGKGRLMPEKIREIQDIGEKHGFRLAPFFWGDKQIRPEMISKIQARVRSA